MPRSIALPPEILMAIFKAGRSSVWSHLEYAMRISQTSRLWRHVALAERSLWSSIVVYVFNSRETWLTLIQTFVERSGSLPLDINIDAVSDSFSRVEFRDDLTPQLAILLPHASRWRSLSIYGSFDQDVIDICTPFENLYVPQLETFELEICPEEETVVEDLEDGPLDLFQGGAPKLTHVKIDGASLTACRLPLTPVTSLQFYYPPQQLTYNQFCNILKAPVHLTDLHLFGGIFNLPFFSGQAPVLLSSLKSLTIKPPLGGVNLLPSILWILETPALECLTVYGIMPQRHSPLLHAFVHGTDGPSKHPLLRLLTLQNANFDEWQGIWIINKLPTITHLSLHNCASSGKFLKLLLPHEPFSWPLLHVIGLSQIGMEDLETLCTVISDRISRGAALSCVRLTSSAAADIPADRMEWLRNNVSVEIGALE